MRCDVIAEGVVSAAREVISTYRWSCGWKAPMSNWARRSSAIGPPILAAENLADAAQKVVTAVKEAA